MLRSAIRIVSAITVSAALAASGLVVAAPASAASTTTLYVSPSGNDSANGASSATAFKTIERAQRAVRDVNSSSNVTVVLGGGTYPVTQSLTFRTADGGRNGNSVTWKAADDQKPVISGGKAVSGWTDSNNDGIWEAPLDSSFDFRQLYVNGAQAVRSNARVDAGKFQWSRSGFTVDGAYTSGTLSGIWSKLRALSTADQKRVELRSRASWTDRIAPFSSISANTVTMRQPSWDNQTWGWDTVVKPLDGGDRKLWIQNALALVDEANEWYFDITAKKLFYKPAAGVDPNSLSVVAPQTETLVSVSGDSIDSPLTNLSFQGLSFQYASDLSANSDDGYANQQNGTVIRGSVYALTDPTTQDIPTSDQRTFDGKDQAPLVRLIRQDSGGVYRYLDDKTPVAQSDLPRLLRLRDHPVLPLNGAQLTAWNNAHPDAKKSACDQGAYAIDCYPFESNRMQFEQVPAAVQVSAARNIAFEGGDFQHIGGKALGIGNNAEAHSSGVGLAAQNVKVVNNTFFDLASSAIVVGGTNTEAQHPTSDAQVNRGFTITDNRMRSTGRDYFDSSAVLVTYVDGAEVAHNELSDGPYDAIDTGFGWGVSDAGGNPTYQGRGAYIFNIRYGDNSPTVNRNVHVANNVMWDFKKEGSDGGILYNLGSTPGSSWDSNYVIGSRGYKLYFDEGTRYMTAKNNVLTSGGTWTFANGFSENLPTPARGQINPTRDNTVDGTVLLGGGYNQGPWCYDSGVCRGANAEFNNNITTKSQIGVKELPLASQRVVAEAGVRPEYRKLGDRYGQSRGLDLSIARDTSGALIVTATIANFGSTALSDIALNVSGSNKVTLQQVTTAPTSLAPGATATATWRATGADAITDGVISADATMTRQEISGTTRETVNKTLPVVLGGAIASDLSTAGFATYQAPQAVQNGQRIALQSSGRDIGEAGDEYTTVYKKQGLTPTGSVTAKFEGAEGNFYRSGLSVRNDLSRFGDRAVADKSVGYATLAIEPGWIAFRYDKDGDGVIDTQVDQAPITARPLWVKITRDKSSLTASYSTDGTTFTALGQKVPLTGATAGNLDAGIVHSSADRTSFYATNALTTSTATFSDLSFTDGSEPVDSAAAQQRILQDKQTLRSSEVNIDSITAIDNGANEAAKNLKSSGSHTGSWLGQSYRDAEKALGSYFQWDLTVDPTQPANYLGVRYFGGDNGRTLDVLVNGVKLKSERITNANGNTFYTQWDQIPASVIADIPAKDSYRKDAAGNYVLDAAGNKIPVVTVRFQSNGTSFVGGVYGAYTARSTSFGTDPSLSKLSFDTGTLSPTFASGTKAYTLTVPSDTSAVTFDADPVVASGLVRLGDILIDDTLPRTVPLAADGTTRITLNTFAQDHTTTTQYVVDVVRAAPIPKLSLQATASSRCIAGRVALTVTIKNTSAQAVDATATTPWGTRSTSALKAGESVSHAFSTRAKSVAAGQATASASANVDGAAARADATADYPALTCN